MIVQLITDKFMLANSKPPIKHVYVRRKGNGQGQDDLIK